MDHSLSQCKADCQRIDLPDRSWRCSIWKTLVRFCVEATNGFLGRQEAYEREGDVDDVVFPCGWVTDEKMGLLKMYYGGADSCIALATASLKELTEYASHCPEPHEE